MSSRSRSTLHGALPPLASSELPSDVVMMRKSLRELLRTVEPGRDRSIGSCKWGVYAFYDFDGEPIYVGQTRESLSGRVNRHLQNQRTDSVAMRILDPMEVAEVEVWPLWELEESAPRRSDESNAEHRTRLRGLQGKLDQAEYSAYMAAIRGSKFKAILNEKIPPPSLGEAELGTSHRRTLYEGEVLRENRNPDVRIARRAESVSRLADVARERGEVTVGLRRVIVIQAVRLAFLSAERLALAEHRPAPTPDAIRSVDLFGQMLPEESTGEHDGGSETGSTSPPEQLGTSAGEPRG